jgi:N-methylhydantoinase A
VDLDDIYNALEHEGRKTLLEAGVAENDMTFIRQADLRHTGQGYDITVTLPYNKLAEVDLEFGLKPLFFKHYEAIYGHAHRHLGVEITTCRLTASGPRPHVTLQQMQSKGGKPEDAIKGYRQAYFAEAGGFVETPLYERSRLSAGMSFEGPAIIEEIDSTAVIGPDTSVKVDSFANLVVTLH